MRQRDSAFVAIHHNGLRVEQRGIAGGGITGVADGESPREAGECAFSKDIGHQAHAFVQVHVHAIGGGDASRLLTAMLQSVQSQVGELGRLRMAIDGKDATFVIKFVAALQTA